MSEKVMWNETGMFTLNGRVPLKINACRRAMPLEQAKKKQHAWVKLLVPDCVVQALLERRDDFLLSLDMYVREGTKPIPTDASVKKPAKKRKRAAIAKARGGSDGW